jgi:hypothetical protein
MIGKAFTKFLMAFAFVAVSTFAFDAAAQNPHFVGDLKATCVGASLRVSFKAAGFGQGATVEATATGDATAQCVTRGGNIPPGQTERVEASTLLTANRTGQVTGSILLASTEECPGNQTLRVTYTNVVLTLDGLSTTLDEPIICSER